MIFMLTMLRSGTSTASRLGAQGRAMTGHVAEPRHALRILDSGPATRCVSLVEAPGDMEYELSRLLTNQTLDSQIETVFLMSRVDYAHLSSTLF
jgi:hypothetical protein